MGLQVDKMPADFFSQIGTLVSAIGSFNPYAFGLAMVSVLGLFLWPRLWAVDSQFRKQIDNIQGISALKATSRLPGPVIALISLSLLAWVLSLPVETIGSRFGGIPQGLPVLQWPAFSWETVKQLVAPTVTIALLGAIESLLCARVADQLSDTPKHDPNQELMAQGIANTVVPFFGGMPATGTVARTVTNIRAGAVSPVAGIVHAATLAAVVLLAAPLAMHIPLAVLAGVLLFVAWNMGEWREFARLKQFSNHYRIMLLSTFVLTIVFDLTVAVELGMVLAIVLFVRRQSALFSADIDEHQEQRIEGRLYGALFFGSVAKLDALQHAADTANDALVMRLDARQLISLDTSGLDALEQLQRSLGKHGGRLVLRGLQAQPRSLLERSGFAQHIDLED
jgi:SulP family sulfate permease